MLSLRATDVFSLVAVTVFIGLFAMTLPSTLTIATTSTCAMTDDDSLHHADDSAYVVWLTITHRTTCTTTDTVRDWVAAG